MQVANVFTTTYHPQCNGQVERYNRTILAMLRNYVNDHQDDWDRYAEGLTFAYNCHVHRATGTTPFDLVLSRPPPEMTLQHRVNKRPKPTNLEKADFLARLQEAMQRAQTRLEKTQSRYKRDYDKSIRVANKDVRVGDWVLMDNPEHQPKKLEPHTQGPFRVLSNDGHTLTIDREGQLERVSSDRVVRYPTPPRARPTGIRTPRTDLPEGVTLSDETYVVDKILDHFVDDEGHNWFKVKYFGYRESSYQPEAALPPELTTRYLSRRARRNVS